MPKTTGDIKNTGWLFELFYLSDRYSTHLDLPVFIIPREAEKDTDIDIKEAIKNDIKEAIKNDIQKGGKYAGLHKGSYKSTTGLDYPKVIELDDKSFEHGSNKLIAKKIDYKNKDINYLFINNPYSSYGALFVDRHNSNLFAESFTDQDSNFKAGYYIKDGIQYNMESLQGKTFAYKGNIIAIARRAIPNTNVTVNDEPTVDGDIAFKIKFKENGEFNHFPGNTVVANLYSKPDLMEVVDIIQSRYRELPFIDKFTLTPRESIHMTVIELLCHENREPEFWSSHLSCSSRLVSNSNSACRRNTGGR